MNCPNCGTQNIDSSKYCLQCGNQLPVVQQTQSASGGLFEYPQDPVGQASTIGGLTGIIGGGLTILGWLLPWFSLGGLVNSVLRFLDLGGGLGGGFGSGVGNGLQLTFFALLGGFAALTEGDTFLIGLFVLIIAAILIAIPILGGINIRTGIRIFEQRASTSSDFQYSPLTGHLRKLRRYSTWIFVIMAIIFVIVSIIPLVGTSILASGFYLTALGAVASFFGALYSQSRIPK